MGNCSEFCGPKDKKEKNTQKLVADGDDFILTCELCKRSVNHTDFKKHLDLAHFAIISESVRQSGLEVHCILCKFQTISLEMHNVHLTNKHKYMDSYRKKIGKEEQKGKNLEAHESIRRRIKKLNKFDFKILKKNKSNPSVAEINGDSFDLYIFEESYSAMEHDQDRAEADLVWRHVFQEYPEASYFAISFQSEQKAIKSTGYLLIKQKKV